jgi:hypothetical protein
MAYVYTKSFILVVRTSRPELVLVGVGIFDGVLEGLAWRAVVVDAFTGLAGWTAGAGSSAFFSSDSGLLDVMLG